MSSEYQDGELFDFSQLDSIDRANVQNDYDDSLTFSKNAPIWKGKCFMN